MSKEAEIGILPPPSEKNPIPSLSAALRFDNHEQLLSFLLTHPNDSTSNSGRSQAEGGGSSGDGTSGFRQSLVFGSLSLQTLIMRQVLTDPHTRTWKNQQSRWDLAGTFPDVAVFGPNELNITSIAILGGGGGGNDSEVTASTAATPARHGAVASTAAAIVGTNVCTYFLRPSDLRQTQAAVQSIFANKNSMLHHRMVYIPQTPAMIRKLLSNFGLNAATSTKKVTIHSLQLDLFPIEPDVISMEFPDAFRELHLEGTPSAVIADAARSILKLQDIVGHIPRIQAYGVAAEQVLRKTMDLAVDEYLVGESHGRNPASSSSHESDRVAALVLLDRKIDMITPMVTSLTYEGLLDDMVGIDSGFLTVDVNIVNPPEDGAEPSQTTTTNANPFNEPTLVTLALNESDSLFAEIRNQHVEQFGSYLQNQAKAMQATQNDFKETGKHKELAELHKFVKQLPGFKQKFQSLSTHIYLAELVKHTSEDATFRERWQMERTLLEGDSCLDELDDLVAMSYPIYRFLRLLCLQSLCKNGINSSRYDSLRKDVVQTYGYEFLSVLVNLEKAGLLRRKEAFLGMEKPSVYAKLKESLVLINAEVDTVEPDDISYTSSGYAPLTVRLLQSAVTGWKNGRDEILRELPGRFFDVRPPLCPPEDLGTLLKRPVLRGSSQQYGSLAPLSPVPLGSTTSGGSKISNSTNHANKPVLIVVYLGGVTYMELASLRFLSKRPNFPYHIICCTTQIINGSSLLQSLA